MIILELVQKATLSQVRVETQYTVCLVSALNIIFRVLFQSQVETAYEHRIKSRFVHILKRYFITYLLSTWLLYFILIY